MAKIEHQPGSSTGLKLLQESMSMDATTEGCSHVGAWSSFSTGTSYRYSFANRTGDRNNREETYQRYRNALALDVQ